MNIRKTALLPTFALFFLLCSCNEKTTESFIGAAETTTITSYSNTEESVEEIKTDTKTVFAENVTLENEKLSVEIEGKTQTFDVKSEMFMIDGNEWQMLSERIINNPFNKKVNAILSFDGEELCSVNVIDANGKYATKDESISLKSCMNNLAVFKSNNIEIKADVSLCDADYIDDALISEPKLMITGFEFSEGGEYICDSILKYEYEDEYGVHFGSECYIGLSYSGIITNVSDDKVSVTLDGEISVTLTPSIVRGTKSLIVGDTVVVRFSNNTSYPYKMKKTNFDFSVIEKLDTIKAEIKSRGGDILLIHADNKDYYINSGSYENNGKSVKESDVITYKSITINPENIKYICYDNGKKVTYLKKAMVEK